MYCFRNGEIIPYEDAFVHVSDLGFLRSYAAFDYLRTYNGRPFHLDDHLRRFRNSAAGLALPLKYNDAEIRRIVLDLLSKSGLSEAGVRLVITGGNSPDSMTTTEPNFFVLVEKLPEYPPGIWEAGVKLITSDYMRDMPAVKSTSYLNAIKLMPLVEQHGAHDMLYCHDGQVLELTRYSFFLFRENTLVTPRDNILPGITRKVILQLCRDQFPVEERAVAVGELAEATEAFLCGTTKGVLPVVQVDDTVIGDGTPGANTNRVMELFAAYTQKY
jgi:branched-subunit amino acid aminotransferase/4-amino-4-deoxychorismate lyase